MLVFSRKKGERVVIGRDTQVVVLEVSKNRVKLGFTGPPEVPIHREEVNIRIENDRATSSIRVGCRPVSPAAD